MNNQKIARIYLRVSTKDQSLERQKRIIEETKEKGFYTSLNDLESKWGQQYPFHTVLEKSMGVTHSFLKLHFVCRHTECIQKMGYANS